MTCKGLDFSVRLFVRTTDVAEVIANNNLSVWGCKGKKNGSDTKYEWNKKWIDKGIFPPLRVKTTLGDSGEI